MIIIIIHVPMCLCLICAHAGAINRNCDATINHGGGWHQMLQLQVSPRGCFPETWLVTSEFSCCITSLSHEWGTTPTGKPLGHQGHFGCAGWWRGVWPWKLHHLEHHQVSSMCLWSRNLNLTRRHWYIYIYIDMTGVKSPWSKKLPVTQSWNVCPLQPADFPKNPCDRVAEVTMGRTGLKRKEVGRLPCDLPCGSLDCRPALSQDPNHSLAKHGKTRSATCFLTDSSQQYTGVGL